MLIEIYAFIHESTICAHICINYSSADRKALTVESLTLLSPVLLLSLLLHTSAFVLSITPLHVGCQFLCNLVRPTAALL